MTHWPQDLVVARLDAAPYDDEPFTDEDRRAIDAALAAPAIPWTAAQPDSTADERSSLIEMRSLGLLDRS